MKTIVIAGGLLASAVLLTGCGLQSLAGPANQDVVNYEVADKVAKLDLRTASGDAVITEHDGTAVRVTETLQWSDTRPEAEHRVDGDTLFMTYTCKGAVNLGRCAVNYKIEIPKGLRVMVDTGSGDITLRSLTGPLETSSGSGEVSGTGLAGKTLVVETGSGDLDLKYASPPDSVEVKTGSGDVVLHVPDGSYAVSTETGSGDVAVSVKDDDASPHKISLKGGSGDISLLPG
ncbi:DUF4097 family beta strand repeat-containing protein [Nonomuraea cavernae]|uniref:DUF4097 domain-containing protein n=1 Tax=Nonomuraea cavernae TaxID=2045107 RepID=A0A917YUV3_9ACTN|nr:DUF4097 family beta strand repeat-containing protein [Nonomuraea cavernae]MCA2185346.1 DUF4097 domain-containing protein [Nonomuraea cavernae]GGO66184.1 hypothetical protein GCM10012289_19590 [Nonomuraea cavernae]